MRLWLKNLREGRRLTMQETAARLCLSPAHYTALEEGAPPPAIPVGLAVKLRDLFDIPLSRLVLYEQDYTASRRPTRAARPRRPAAL